MPGQQPGSFWAAAAKGGTAVSPNDVSSITSSRIVLLPEQRIPEEESITALFMVVCGAGRGGGGGVTSPYFFLAWVHYATAVKSLPAPMHLAMVSGEGRASPQAQQIPAETWPVSPCLEGPC